MAELVAVFFTFAVAPALHLGPHADVAKPVRLRLALQRLGGAWLKLGQMLAMRVDILPAPYCHELFRLLNQVEPFSYAAVSDIIRDQLGDKPEAVFASFEQESFAAASIGQVHRATLPSGERVAVKIQRPGVRQAFRADIDLMYAVTGILDLAHAFGSTGSRDVIDEFARWTADELDYLVEARQATQLFEQSRDEPAERIARVFREYTTSTVLTTELIEGIPLSEIVVAMREGDEAYLRDLADRGHDLDRIVRHLDWNMLNEVYVFGYFHADLHPANLFVLPGDAIGYVDFGIVGQLPDRVRESLTRYGWRLFQGDVERAVDELMRWVAPGTDTDPAAARRALVRSHQDFLYATAPSTASEMTSSARSGPALTANPYLRLGVAVMDTVRLHEMTLAAGVVSYFRMLVTLGTLRHQLRREYDVARTARRFFVRLMRRRMVGWLDPRTSLERLDIVAARFERAVELFDTIEAQAPLITSATSSLLGVRRRARAARRGIMRLATATLIVGAGLYFVLADPSGTRALLPAEVSYDVVHLGLVILLVALILRLVLHVRSLGVPD
jgi:predicted unusual protein kinase regulating ubiquinone biosynthesis (AarF/ABC1/UbiB family)